MTEDNNCEPKPDDVDYVVYAKQLFGCHLGYPIWFPKSGDRHDIQIGDVGYYFQGGFHRVFNTTLLDDDPSHIHGLPYNYEPFQVELQKEEVGRITLVDRSVKYVQVQGGGGSDSTAVSPTRLGMSSTLDRCAAPAGGAFSSFAPPVDRLQIHPSKSFVAYMRANFQRWNAFLDSKDVDVTEVPLLFVSGTVKISKWGCGAFKSHFGVQVDQAWMASDQADLKDQTLFINYFRMKDQEAHQKDGDVEGTVASMYDPVNDLLDYILEYRFKDKTQPKIAIASDTHLYDLFDGEVVPIDIRAALAEMKPPVVFVDDQREGALYCNMFESDEPSADFRPTE